MFPIKKIILLLTLLIFLTGCWDRNEISDVNFIMGIAIDLTDEHKYRVTFQWALPSQFSTESSQGSGNSNENTVYTIEADSIALAMAKLTEVSTRVPIYSHMALIVLGESLAKESAEDFFHVVDREFEMRRTINIVLAKGKAEDILRSKTPFETVQATGVDKIISLTNRSSTFQEVKLNDLFIKESDPDSLSFMPIADTVSNTNLQQTDKGGRNSWVQVERVAFFDNYKLVRELSMQESRSWMYALGEVGEQTVTEFETEKGKLIARVLSQKTDEKITIKSNQPSVTYTIKEQVSILEEPKNLSTTEMETEIETYIKEQLSKTIQKMQEEKLDVFFLRTKLRQHHPKEWQEIKKHWAETYAKMEFDINVEVTIQHHNALRKNVSH